MSSSSTPTSPSPASGSAATVPDEAEKGFAALDKVVQVSPRESRLWWQARVVFFEGLDPARDRGRPPGPRARAALRREELPGLETAARFGLAPRLLALEAKVAARGLR